MLVMTTELANKIYDVLEDNLGGDDKKPQLLCRTILHR